MKSKSSANLPACQTRIRIYAGGRMLGPGKMELLAQIETHGSLSAASREMSMSYMRAWKLVQDLNRDPARPVVQMSRGGATGGAGKLTRFGKQLLDLYQQMDQASATAAKPYARQFASLLK